MTVHADVHVSGTPVSSVLGMKTRLMRKGWRRQAVEESFLLRRPSSAKLFEQVCTACRSAVVASLARPAPGGSTPLLRRGPYGRIGSFLRLLRPGALRGRP